METLDAYQIGPTDFKGSSCPIQVKAIKGGAWQFSIDKFAEITFDGNVQRIGDKRPLHIPDLVCVFVLAAKNYGEDQFFILEWSQVEDILVANYRRWLDSHGGVRPRKASSLHCATVQSDLQEFKDNWSIIQRRL